MIISSCSNLPFNVAICGNDICEADEDDICPSDCEELTTTTTPTTSAVECDYTCGDAEMCVGYFGDGDTDCCVGSCTDEITEIAFDSGWNFVSFPFVQINDNIEDLFAEIVDADDGSTEFLDAVDSIYSYQNGWMVWHSDESIPSDLETIEAGRGYVIIMNSAFTISLDDLETALDTIMEDEGSSRSPHEIDAWAGWNIVGSTYGADDENKEKPLEDYFNNIDGIYQSLWKTDYDGDLEEIFISDNENLIPTYAYWLYLDSDGEIIP